MKHYYKNSNVTVYHGDCLELLPGLEEESIDSVVTDPPYGLGFMDKDWDHGVPGIPFWKAVNRVCKPGAFLLAFSGTRTYHRLTVAIEDAGWEIRDQMQWLYSSGFPKSHNISLAIDKHKGAIGHRGKAFVTEGAGDRKDIQGTQGTDGMAYTAPITETAQLWNGWGTALKPAHEPICVAIKPMPSTFAANALQYGVAGLNIDGCKVGTDTILVKGFRAETGETWGGAGMFAANVEREPTTHQGRWPANILHDGSDDVLALLPMMENGSAARFFYCAKASKSERGQGNSHPTVKPLELMKYLCKLTMTPTGGIVLDPFAGSGTTGVACHKINRKCILIEKEEKFCEIIANRLGDCEQLSLY